MVNTVTFFFGQDCSSQTPTVANTSICQGERDAPAATSQGDPAQVTDAYRFDIWLSNSLSPPSVHLFILRRYEQYQ